MERHPVLAAFVMPEPSAAALTTTCKYVSLLDYTQGLGHAEARTIGGAEPDAPG